MLQEQGSFGPRLPSQADDDPQDRDLYQDEAEDDEGAEEQPVQHKDGPDSIPF